MTFLAFDTSGEMCVLALADEDGTVKAVSIFEGKRSLSRRLMGEVDSLLTRNGLTLQDLTGLAVGLGPGSFTGVRVGVTTAKTLAQVTGKPLMGVGTLDAYAAVWLTHDDDTRIVPVLPSRRGEVYAAVYLNGGRQGEPFAASFEEMAARLASMDDAILCGSPQLLPNWTGAALAQPWTPPEGLAKIAARRLAAGDIDDPLALVPLYVVAPSISTPKPTPAHNLATPPETGREGGSGQTIASTSSSSRFGRTPESEANKEMGSFGDSP